MREHSEIRRIASEAIEFDQASRGEGGWIDGMRRVRLSRHLGMRHRDSQHLNNRLEQDHRGVKGRYGRTPGARSESPSVRASRLMSCARAVSRGVSVAPDLPAYH
jgi:transposase-like protein